MQCKDVEFVLEQDGLIPVPAEVRAHTAVCDACRNMIADLTGIVSVAHSLPAEVEPPAHVWTALRSRLEAEGIIKTPSIVLEHQSPWRSFANLFSNRAFATVGVGLLIVVAAVVQLIPRRNVERAQVVPVATPSLQDPYAQTALTLDQEEQDLSNMHLAGTNAVDTSLRQNLATLDEFIIDCRQHLKEDPQDELAREYLSGAYRQKAELLSAMMERGGSVN
jgi:hypothetical protein